MLKKREAPALYYGNVPESQHHAHDVVGGALDNLNHCLDCFESALKLHDHGLTKLRSAKGITRKHLYRHWQFIAARDGAVSIFNFKWALEGLGDSVNQCDYLKERLDLAAIRAAKRLFDKHFPNATQVRHAVAHATEKSKNPREHLEHGYTGVCKIPGLNLGKVRNFVITDHLYRRSFCNTWKGKIECYKLSKGSLKNLSLVRDAVYDAFDAMNNKFAGT